VKKEWIIVGLVAVTLAGCGSSSSSSSSGGSTASQAPAASTPTQTSGSSSAGHASEWSSADTAQAESDLNKESQGEGLSAAFKQCLVKGVEETFSPSEYKKDNAENKEAGKARGVAEACAKKFPPTGK
jgi:ABC-type phosphate transport system substrate-binding protein